ncbi:ATP-binding protein [Kutzneria buriramensis]|uniref:histidine kinase n=1 Tax=Kutzneria buriramensis TaxID=1045776 RepID=A0A3E0HD04_9PSEU|nr:ATP-binding protein [Kutzneria buriramensis]REH42542.1 HAMP domain-containing protein [Kutzneria buriramensis]
MSARHRPAGGEADDPGPGPLATLVAPGTIRGRLARILVLSLALVLALLGVTIAGQVVGYLTAGDTVSSVSLALKVQDFVQEVQRERGLTNGMLGGETRFQQTLLTQRTATDKAQTALNQALADDSGPGVSQVRDALAHLSGLTSTRESVDAGRADRSATFQYYTEGIAALNGLQLGLDQAQDPQLRRGLQALYALGDAKEYTGQERGFLNGVFAAGKFGAGEYVHFTEIRASKQAGLTEYARYATQPQQAALDAALRSDNATKAAASEAIAIASTKGPVDPQVDPVTWWSQMTSVIDAERKVQQSVGDDLTARAQDLQGQAAAALIAYLVVALLAVAAEVLLVITSIRSIVRPLAALATEADDVATRRLPASIAAWHQPGEVEPERPQPVRTPPKAGAEIASVAQALDRVQTTAFELASEQALVRRNTTESLANLGRRNQNLVRRQLTFISDFEQEELDPSALANLFELDHLATRMRRNAESLLVLVGETSPRRWGEPLSLSDVIRAGLSEVEDYRRVVLRRVDETMITGAVVSELAHMLAELIENGLAFSPPDLEVEIYGRRLATGYMLAVVDHGVGMTKEQLAKANARLRGEEDFIVAPTRFLGHYVVGRLAQRLGIEVELTVSPVSGIVARLLLPPDLLAEAPSSPQQPAPPQLEVQQMEVRQAEPRRPEARQPEITWPAAEPEAAEPVVRQPQPPAPVRTRQERLASTPAAVVAVPAQPAAESRGDVPVQRTKNGLVKRNRGRAEDTSRPAAPSRPPTAVENRSPEEVRSMLSSFRTGHQRGERGPLPARVNTLPEEEHR